MVEEVTEAFTDAPVVAFNPVAGDHAYVLAPEAVSEVAAGLVQELYEVGVTETEGRALIFTTVVSDTFDNPLLEQEIRRW